MRKTIRKVTMVVPVLMTSCQVSEKPKSGPVTAQTTTTPAATAKAGGRPVARAVHLAKRVNHEVDFDGLTDFPSHPRVRASRIRARAPSVAPRAGRSGRRP